MTHPRRLNHRLTLFVLVGLEIFLLVAFLVSGFWEGQIVLAAKGFILIAGISRGRVGAGTIKLEPGRTYIYSTGVNLDWMRLEDSDPFVSPPGWEWMPAIHYDAMGVILSVPIWMIALIPLAMLVRLTLHCKFPPRPLQRH